MYGYDMICLRYENLYVSYSCICIIFMRMYHMYHICIIFIYFNIVVYGFIYFKYLTKITESTTNSESSVLQTIKINK